jgi:hypothetical protein
LSVILITSIVISLDRVDLHPTKGKRILITNVDGNDQYISKLLKLYYF